MRSLTFVALLLAVAACAGSRPAPDQHPTTDPEAEPAEEQKADPVENLDFPEVPEK